MKKFNRYTETGLGVANNGKLLYPNEYKFEHMSVVKIGDVLFTGIAAYQPPYILTECVFVVVSLPVKDTEYSCGERFCFDVEQIKTKEISKMYTTDYNHHIANSWLNKQPTLEYIPYNTLTPEQVVEILQEKKYEKIKKEFKELPKNSLKDFPDFGYYVYPHDSKYYHDEHCIYVSKYGIFEFVHATEFSSSKISYQNWKRISNESVNYIKNRNTISYYKTYDELTSTTNLFPRCIVDKTGGAEWATDNV